MFKILDAKNDLDYKLWIDLWTKSEDKDVFSHPDYINLYIKEFQEAKCAVFSKDTITIFYPFIKRKICTNFSDGIVYSDLISVYGYADIQYIGNPSELNSVLPEFTLLFSTWAVNNNVVSEFIRFSLFSLYKNYYFGEVLHNNDNIVVDLSKGVDYVWNNFNRKVRKNVNKANSFQLEIKICQNDSMIESFKEIYYKTMDRRNASQGYYFNDSYFAQLTNNLDKNYVLFYVLKDDRVISTELVLVSNDTIYSFLGGTSEEFFDMRPNDFLKFEIMKWGISNGVSKFVLGGGYNKNDGIFNYKLAFAPHGIIPFYVGKKIFNEEIYNKLVSQIRSLNNTDISLESFFPLYRIFDK